MRPTSLTLVTAFALAASAAAGTEELTQEQYAKLSALYREAKSARTLKDYAKSNVHLEELLGVLPRPKDSRLEPNFARVHYDLSSNHALLGNKKEALVHLSKAVDFGFWDHEFLSRDEALASLRGDKEFDATLDRARRSLGEIAFGLKDISGKELKKEEYAGKVVVLDIWGTWCPPCRMEIPHFVALQKKYESQGLAMVGLVWERRPPDDGVKSRVAKFLEENRVNYPNILATPDIIQAVPRLYSFPTTIYIARDGRIVDRVAGAEQYAQIEKRVLKLLAEKPPASDATKGAPAK